MWHFTLPLHATPEELVALAERWAQEHALYVSLERFYPVYAAAAVPLAGDLAGQVAVEELETALCLRHVRYDRCGVTAEQPSTNVAERARAGRRVGVGMCP